MSQIPHSSTGLATALLSLICFSSDFTRTITIKTQAATSSLFPISVHLATADGFNVITPSLKCACAVKRTLAVLLKSA